MLEEKNLSKEALEKFTELQNLYFENQDYLEKSKELTREILETEKLLLSNEELLEESRKKFEEGLQPIEVNVCAQLGDTHITVNDFLRLTKGDIIKP